MIIEIANKTFTELNDMELDTIAKEGTVVILASPSYIGGQRFKVSRYEKFGPDIFDGDFAYKASTHTLELARQVADLVKKSPLPIIT